MFMYIFQIYYGWPNQPASVTMRIYTDTFLFTYITVRVTSVKMYVKITR